MFCSLLNIYVRWYIYCYTNKSNFTIFLQLLTCVNALKHFSYRALVLWANFFFFSQILNSNYSAMYSSYIFFPFKYLCKLVYILLYWYNEFHNIFTIIDVSISYQSKQNNKIWDCDQSQLKINVLRKCYNTYCAVLLVYSTGTVATVPNFFFFKYLCKLVYILLYWHNKFHNIFIIIDVSISYKLR